MKQIRYIEQATGINKLWHIWTSLDWEAQKRSGVGIWMAAKYRGRAWVEDPVHPAVSR